MAPDEHKASALRRVAATAEGKILIAGILLAVLYLAAIVLVRYESPAISHKLLRMTGAHVLAGRAVGMSTGYAEHVPTWLVIVGNMIIETFMVMLCYPLFVLSYRKLIIIKPLKEQMERAHQAAAAAQPKIIKYGVPALILFVWFPLWMTGPVVGAIIGFLIGLRPLVNLAAVLGGTYLAILCWGMLLKNVHDQLDTVSPYLPVIFVGIVLLIAVSIHIRYAVMKPPPPTEPPPTSAGDKQ